MDCDVCHGTNRVPVDPGHSWPCPKCAMRGLPGAMDLQARVDYLEHENAVLRGERVGRVGAHLMDQLAEAVKKSQERLCHLVMVETRLASAELSLRNHAPEVYKAHLEWCERELGHAKPGPARMCSEVDETEEL